MFGYRSVAVLLLVIASTWMTLAFRVGRHRWRHDCRPAHPLDNMNLRIADMHAQMRREMEMMLRGMPFYAGPAGLSSTLVDERMGMPCEGPVVEPLTYGWFRLNNESLELGSTVSLVTDEKLGRPCLILVDTGTVAQRGPLSRGLSTVGVRPEYVQAVVLSHLDLDTVGNLNLFPDARVFAGNRVARAGVVRLPSEAESGRTRQLCDNTLLYATPGFTADDLSLVVKNVSGFGTVAITGNLILDADDIDENESVNRFHQNAEHRRQWMESRTEILCMSDYIVPGYGRVFNVTTEIKQQIKCPGF